MDAAMDRMQKKSVNSLCGLYPAVAAVLFVSMLLIQQGCHPGIISVIGTPTSAEAKVPPEFDLPAEKGKKILILVEQPSSLNAQTNLRFPLTDSVANMLKMRAKILPEDIIAYDKLADYRAENRDFSMMPAEQIGAALGADIVLLITVDDYKLLDVGETGYINGSMTASAQIIDTASGRRLWPQIEQARIARVGFESERLGREAAAVRLAVDAAHCITRYLYNCQKNQFKISDEITGTGWE
jgi:hypothetical protein